MLLKISKTEWLRIACVATILCLCLFGAVKVVAFGDGFSTTAQSAMVMEKQSGRVLFEKNADQKLPMASTTKILTALVVAENCAMDDVVCVPKAAVGVEGSSVYLREGEHLTVKELLFGLMLRSGNDCAVALALHTAGSVEQFAALMNRKAAELGATNSSFANPHGLHDENHYTTARDLAKISCAALKNPHIAEIVSTKKVNVSNEGMDYDRVLVNKNKLLSSLDDADGVKTGYTKKAGRCFVGSATRNGMQVVVVVLNCGPMFEETKAMLNTAFAQYSLHCLIPQNKLFGVVFHNGKPKYFTCQSGFSYPLKPSEVSQISKQIDIDEQSGEGEIKVFLAKQLLFSQKMVTI